MTVTTGGEGVKGNLGDCDNILEGGGGGLKGNLGDCDNWGREG